MSTAINREPIMRRSVMIWLLPLQAVCACTAWAAMHGGQWLRGWILGALVFAMALPLALSLEASMIAMMLFEPLRGFLRRAQYLLVDYSQTDPIHVLTPIVTLIAFCMLLRKYRFQIFRATTLARTVSMLSLIFVLQIFNPLQGGLVVGLSGALLILVPVTWFYFGQFVDERFVTITLRLMVIMGLLASLYGIYQLTFGYPRFEQYWIDHIEDLYVSLNVGHVKRALATFCSAEEWGRYIEIGAIVAFGLGVGARRILDRAGWIGCGLGLSIILLLTGQRTAIFGLLLGFFAFVVLGARTLRGAAARTVILLLPIVLISVLVKAPSEDEMWSKQEDQRVGALLSHTERGTLHPTEEESLYVRFDIWSDLAVNVIPYRPFGAGLGAGSVSAWKFNTDGGGSPPIDNFILTLAVATGIPGALLFVWILGRATVLAFRSSRRTETPNRRATINRIAIALMPMLLLNSVFGMTFSLYAVAPLCWLLIGWISAEDTRWKNEVGSELRLYSD
jgi:O-Antigen ligase